MPLLNYIGAMVWWKKTAAPAPAQPMQIFGKTLVDLNAGHVALLQQIKSPFLLSIRMASAMGAAKTEEEKKALLSAAATIEIEIKDIALIVLVFSRPSPETRRILQAPEGRAALDAEADALMALMPPLADWECVQSALAAHYTLCLYSKMKFLQA